MSTFVTPSGKDPYGIWIGNLLPEEVEQALTVTAETLKSDEALWVIYEYWRKYYGVTHDRAETLRRFKIFKRNAKVCAQNQQFRC
jgi:hypothetical protein